METDHPGRMGRCSQQHFGESPPWSVGIEEELFVLDAETLEPVPVPPDLLDGDPPQAGALPLPARADDHCLPVGGGGDERARVAPRRRGTRGRWAGAPARRGRTHPFAGPAEQELTDDPGLAAFAEYAGHSARVQYCCGLHVHVGVPGADDCLDRLEAVLPWLPVVLALSANSPYFSGRETGYASTRAELLTRLPRTAAPPAFGSYAGWETYVERLIELGLADDYIRTWWDIRPHPRLGTLELRMPDQPTSLELTAAFAALGQALVARQRARADRGSGDLRPEPLRRAALRRRRRADPPGRLAPGDGSGADPGAPGSCPPDHRAARDIGAPRTIRAPRAANPGRRAARPRPRRGSARAHRLAGRQDGGSMSSCPSARTRSR